MEIVAGTVLHLRTIVDPSGNELVDSQAELVIATPVPARAFFAGAGSPG